MAHTHTVHTYMQYVFIDASIEIHVFVYDIRVPLSYENGKNVRAQKLIVGFACAVFSTVYTQ